MCGFVGFVSDRPLPLGEMTRALAHRGPDAEGTRTWEWGERIAGLGHRRLSVLDVSAAGHQPMPNADASLWIAYNGEFYEYRRARRQLEAAGHRFRSGTDTEVILHLYEERGDRALGAIDGMFGFAILDLPRRRMLVARDRLGKKPVYYYHAGQTLIVASEIGAIVKAGAALDPTLDAQALHNYLALGYIPAPRTIYERVKKLPPGHRLTWEDGKVEVAPYWELGFRRRGAPPPPSFEEAAEEVSRLLRRAVERRLVADVPVGVFLSGGLDSALVTATMVGLASEPVRSFTIGFENPSYDESGPARETASFLGTRHTEAVLRPAIADLVFEVVDKSGEPFADSSALPTWLVSRLARQQVTVALGGDGGDELFAGYRVHLAQRLAAAYRRLPSVVRERLIPWAVDRLPVSHGPASFDLKAKRFVAAANLPDGPAHCGFREALPEGRRRALFAAGATPPATSFDDVYTPHLRRAQAFPDPLDRFLYLDHLIYLPDDILTKVDRMSMAHGLEVRAPFLDHELVEYAAQLPSDYKLRGLRGKRIMREVMVPVLPSAVINRRKAGFSVPIPGWLNGSLKPLVETYLSPARMRDLACFDPRAIAALLNEHRQRAQDHSRVLWALLLFSIWCERTPWSAPWRR